MHLVNCVEKHWNNCVVGKLVPCEGYFLYWIQPKSNSTVSKVQGVMSECVAADSSTCTLASHRHRLAHYIGDLLENNVPLRWTLVPGGRKQDTTLLR